MPSKSSLTPDELVKRLSGYDLLQDVPEEQLQWLASQASLQPLAPGEKLFSKGDPIDTLFIIMSGKIQFKLEQQGEYRIINELIEGDISGALPYSRAKTAMALGEAQGETLVLALPNTHFKEMIHHQPDLTEALVHVMTSRVRDFTREQQQTEKLAALGRLSAGLHHELNNPAAAALRASMELKELLNMAPEKFKAIMLLDLVPEQVDQINDLVFSRKEKPPRKLGMMERSELEGSLADWLEKHQLEDAYTMAEAFAQHHFDLEVFQELEEIAGTENAGAVADWIYNVLATDSLVAEIQESTRRISTLVGAVKSYSHMDRGAERERTDLESSIRNTLTMLNFKIKKKQIKVSVDAPENLPHPCVFTGELNQVWTNLIDNAIDAMEEGGQLAIQLKEADEAIEVEITDNGSGIPEEVRDRIFEPFFSTKSMGQGSGMGLEITNNIVKQHGGAITVSSEPGQTTFKIRLPENPTI